MEVFFNLDVSPNVYSCPFLVMVADMRPRFARNGTAVASSTICKNNDQTSPAGLPQNLRRLVLVIACSGGVLHKTQETMVVGTLAVRHLATAPWRLSTPHSTPTCETMGFEIGQMVFAQAVVWGHRGTTPAATRAMGGGTVSPRTAATPEHLSPEKYASPASSWRCPPSGRTSQHTKGMWDSCSTPKPPCSTSDPSNLHVQPARTPWSKCRASQYPSAVHVSWQFPHR